MHDYVVGAASTGDNAVLAMLENHAMVLAPPAGATKSGLTQAFAIVSHGHPQKKTKVFIGLLSFWSTQVSALA